MRSAHSPFRLEFISCGSNEIKNAPSLRPGIFPHVTDTISITRRPENVFDIVVRDKRPDKHVPVSYSSRLKNCADRRSYTNTGKYADRQGRIWKFNTIGQQRMSSTLCDVKGLLLFRLDERKAQIYATGPSLTAQAAAENKTFANKENRKFLLISMEKLFVFNFRLPKYKSIA